jgi:hypothetical protein
VNRSPRKSTPLFWRISAALQDGPSFLILRYFIHARYYTNETMLLVLEIAAGVALGLMLYRLAIWLRPEIPALIAISIFAIGIIGLFGLLIVFAYFVITNPERLAAHKSVVLGTALLIAILGFGRSLRADLHAGKAAQKLADVAICKKCGKSGLRFHRFKGSSSQTASGKEHEHPTAICSACKHEQELSA